MTFCLLIIDFLFKTFRQLFGVISVVRPPLRTVPENSSEKNTETQKPTVNENKTKKQDNNALTSEQQKRDNKYAAIIITVVIIAIIISNVTAVLFWTVVDRFKREDTPKSNKEKI